MTNKEKFAQELIWHMNELLTIAHQAKLFFSFVSNRDDRGGTVIWSNEDTFDFHIHNGSNINI